MLLQLTIRNAAVLFSHDTFMSRECIRSARTYNRVAHEFARKAKLLSGEEDWTFGPSDFVAHVLLADFLAF